MRRVNKEYRAIQLQENVEIIPDTIQNHNGWNKISNLIS